MVLPSRRNLTAFVLRLGFGRGVDVAAADVEVVIVLGQLGASNDTREAGDVLKDPVGRNDLLDVLGLQEVLRPPFPVVSVGVDEQDLTPTRRRL